MKSESYKEEVGKYASTPEACSPINLCRQAVAMGHNQMNKECGYNLPGILVLLHHAFINRSATRKILLKTTTQKQLAQKLPYNIVRAAAKVAGEIQPVPDPVSLLAYIGCANVIFRRWSVHLYNSNLRTDDEFPRSSYKMNETQSRRFISIDYNLCDMAKNYRITLTDENLLRKLRLSCHGYLLPALYDMADTPTPFNPIEEVKLALGNKGYYPTVTVEVPREWLPKKPEPPQSATVSGEKCPEVQNRKDNEEDVDQQDDTKDDDTDKDSDDGGRDDERSIAGSLSDDESDGDNDVNENVLGN